MEPLGGEQCLNCGEALGGEFCARCGQDAHEGRHPTLGHFAHELMHEVLHLDGKIGRTLKALLLQPGRLTREYWDGRINSWIRPIRMFLTVVAINLLLVHDGVGPMNFRTRVERRQDGDINITLTTDPDRVKGRSGYVPASEAETAVYMAKMRKAYSSVRYFSVILFAGASWLLYRRRQPYFANHLVFGCHYYSFWYASALLGSLNATLSSAMGAGMWIYLMLALRRLHEDRWTRTLFLGTLLFMALVVFEVLLGVAAIEIAQHRGA